MWPFGSKNMFLKAEKTELKDKPSEKTHSRLWDNEEFLLVPSVCVIVSNLSEWSLETLNICRNVFAG